MIDSERTALDGKVRGWEWVTAQLAALRDDIRAEAERLLGPERGE